MPDTVYVFFIKLLLILRYFILFFVGTFKSNLASDKNFRKEEYDIRLYSSFEYILLYLKNISESFSILLIISSFTIGDTLNISSKSVKDIKYHIFY